jgi:hypothetical protein
VPAPAPPAPPAGAPPPGRPAAARRGIGLANTAARLAALYGAAHRLDVRTNPAGGTTVELAVPLRYVPAPPPAEGTPAEGEPAEGTPAGRAGSGRADPPRGTADDAPMTVDLAAPDLRLDPPRGLVAWARAVAPGGPARRDRPPQAEDELPLRGAGAIALLWGLVALCWSAQFVVGRYAAGGAEAVRTSWRWGVALQAVCAALWALLTPGVLRLARRLRLTRERWAGPLAAHAAVAAALAPAQLALTLVLAGEPPHVFDAGMVNPLWLNVFIYVALVAWTHARTFDAWYRERATAADRLAAELERTRLHSLAVEVNADYVTALLEACAALATARPAAAERLVEGTADLLRAMLDEARARVPTLGAELGLMGGALALLEQGTGRPARLRVDVPRAWRGAGVGGGGLRLALGLAARRLGEGGAYAGGVDVVVTPAPPLPAGGGRIPLGRVAVRVTPRRPADPPADPRAGAARPGAPAPAPTFVPA